MDEYTAVRLPGAKQLKISFDERTATEGGCDYITLYTDTSHNVIVPGGEKLTGGKDGSTHNWPGKGEVPPLFVDGDSFEFLFHRYITPYITLPPLPLYHTLSPILPSTSPPLPLVPLRHPLSFSSLHPFSPSPPPLSTLHWYPSHCPLLLYSYTYTYPNRSSICHQYIIHLQLCVSFSVMVLSTIGDTFSPSKLLKAKEVGLMPWEGPEGIPPYLSLFPPPSLWNRTFIYVN